MRPSVPLSQFNPGTQDLSRPVDPDQTRAGSITPSGAGASPQPGTDTTTLPGTTTGQIGIDPTTLLNPETTTSAEILGISGAIPPPFQAAAGGSPRTGARGADMDGCMAAWDAKTHINKTRWREICSRTLGTPHL